METIRTIDSQIKLGFTVGTAFCIAMVPALAQGTVALQELRLFHKTDGSPFILGKGNFGTVYKAQFRGDLVAVKVFPISNQPKGEVRACCSWPAYQCAPGTMPHCYTSLKLLSEDMVPVQESFRKEIALLRKCENDHIVGFRAA